MNLDTIDKEGTTTVRKSFWDSVVGIVEASVKKSGHNVEVNERENYGSVINVTRERGGTPTVGACCIDGVCSIASMADCIEGGGNFLGNGTTCDDVDCTQGACCHTDGTCTDGAPFLCSSPSVYKGDGTTCAMGLCIGACRPQKGCPEGCFCVDGLTYDQCHDTYFNTCQDIAWFLDSPCSSHTCPSPSGLGACCNEFGDPGCTDETTEDDCLAFGGSSWHEGCTCEDLTCWDGCEIPAGAGGCIIDDVCSIAYSDVCAELGGTYLGDGIPC